MLIAELRIDHPVLAEPLRQVDGIEIDWEETYERDGRTQMLAWIASDNWREVEGAIDGDPAIGDSTLLTEVDGRRLYRVEFAELGDETNLMPEFIEVGAVLQSAIGDNDGWTIRARYPDRGALSHIYQFCDDRDITVSVESVFDQRFWASERLPALTEPQRLVLVEAVECGYLSIPRECSLAEIGKRLGISDSAASERIRRAVRNLVEQTVL